MRMLNQNQKQVRSYLRVTCGLFSSRPVYASAQTSRTLAVLFHGKKCLCSTGASCIKLFTAHLALSLASSRKAPSKRRGCSGFFRPRTLEKRGVAPRCELTSARSSCESRASRTAQGWRGKRRRQATILSAITPRCTKKPSDSSPRATPD